MTNMTLFSLRFLWEKVISNMRRSSFLSVSKALLCFFVLFSMQIMGDPYDPPIIYLTWQRSPETTMTIQWISSERYPADIVQYQEEGLGGFWDQSEGSHTPMPNAHPDLIHSVELTELNPDTVYQFRFGKDGIVYKFRTMPAHLDKAIRFAVGGDMYHDSIEKLKETNVQAARTDPMFVLVGGDIAYSFGRFSSKKEMTQREERV